MSKYRWIVRIALGTAGTVIVAAVIAAGFQFWVVGRFARNFSPPGELIDVGGHRLHLNCTGEGDRTVVLEAGSRSWSLDWHLVQSEIAEFARVCSYDRAGAGWSEPAPVPRDIDRMVTELRTLLRNASIEGPYILVGASFGGSVIQLFENRHPDLVEALVLVDGRSKDYVREYRRIAPHEKTRRTDDMRTIVRLYELGLLSAVVNIEPPEGVPSGLREIYLDRGLMTKQAVAWAREAIADWDSDEEMQRIDDVGDKPLVVISHGKRNMFQGRPGLSEEQATSAEALWTDLQQELVGLSTRGRLVIAERSGHLIQFEQPSIVVQEVKNLVNELLLPGSDATQPPSPGAMPVSSPLL